MYNVLNRAVTHHSIATGPLGELWGTLNEAIWSPAQLLGTTVQETGKKLEFAKLKVASQVEFRALDSLDPVSQSSRRLGQSFERTGSQASVLPVHLRWD